MSATVQILMATYNGEPYLAAQLDSLLQQTEQNFQILIRDDGSSDGTLSILRAYQTRFGGRLHWIEGKNLGFVANFFELFAAASPDAQVYLCSDQDDIWLPDKVARALAVFQQQDATVPLVYFSRLKVVDSELNLLSLSPLIKRWSLGNALLESPITGCTMAFNQPFIRLLRLQRPEPKFIIAHDWWCYLLATAFGQLIYDPEPTILYRQHASNAVGTPAKRLKALMQRSSNFRNGTWASRRPEPMIKHFLELYGLALQASQRKLLQSYCERRGVSWQLLKAALIGKIWRRGALNSLVMWLGLFVRPVALNSKQVKP